MASKKGGKATIEIYGISDLLKKLEKAGGDLESAITKAVEKSIEIPKQDMMNFMAQHHKTGGTEESFTVTPIKWKDGLASVQVGFSVRKGGLPAIFLNYGTPKIQPSFFIQHAVDDNIDAIHEIHRNTLEEILKELI